MLQSGIDVAVPKTKTVKEITEQRTVLTIDKDQRVFLGDQPINLGRLADAVAAAEYRCGTSGYLSACG